MAPIEARQSQRRRGRGGAPPIIHMHVLYIQVLVHMCVPCGDTDNDKWCIWQQMQMENPIKWTKYFKLCCSDRRYMTTSPPPPFPTIGRMNYSTNHTAEQSEVYP